MICHNNTFNVNNPPPLPIFLGFPGENDSRPVIVDVSPWLEEFPDATVSFVYTRHDKLTYAVVVNQPGPVVTWKPLEEDLVNGDCSLQIQIKQGAIVKKSCIIACRVGESLDDPSDPPQPPRPTYVEEVIEAAADAEAAVSHYPQIRNGYWWVWDVENGEWVNTGVKATGEGGGSSTVIVTVDDTTDPMTASMNAAQIKSAADAGNRVVIKIRGIEFSYFGTLDDTAVFPVVADTTGVSYMAVLVGESGNAIVENVPLARMADISNFIKFVDQTLTDGQKLQARANIGAAKLTVVEVNTEADPVVASMTPAEIKAAVDAGDIVRLDAGGVLLDFQNYLDLEGGIAYFSDIIDNTCITVFVNTNKQIGQYTTPIPTALSDLSSDSMHRTVTDAEKATWNAKGTYSKPSGGIPASDLAAGVIPTVPQMATAADMSDWTSGKTVDAGAAATVFAAADTAMRGKLNTNQGATNAGKFMVVGSDGNVVTVTMSTWQGGSY